jgi:hypothetical protein
VLRELLPCYHSIDYLLCPWVCHSGIKPGNWLPT